MFATVKNNFTNAVQVGSVIITSILTTPVILSHCSNATLLLMQLKLPLTSLMI
jgi:hypothetical protein